jgi:hypothetical protein
LTAGGAAFAFVISLGELSELDAAGFTDFFWAEFVGFVLSSVFSVPFCSAALIASGISSVGI